MKRLLAISLTTVAAVVLVVPCAAAPAGAWYFEGLSAPEKAGTGLLQATMTTLAGPTTCNYGFDPCFAAHLDVIAHIPGAPPLVMGSTTGPDRLTGGLNTVAWDLTTTCVTTAPPQTLQYDAVFTQRYHDQGMVVATETWTATAFHTCP
jgi:hypothetical protein